MANFNSYPLKDFSSIQKFIANENTGQVVRVSGQDILDASIDALLKSGDAVNSIDTLTEAIATDYLSGVYVLTGGTTVTLDGGQSIYRVSDPGSGGIVMDNGNELLLLFQANAGDAGSYNVGTAAGELATNQAISSQVHGGQFMTYGGAADVVTLTSVNTVALTALVEGGSFTAMITTTNTGAATANIDGIGALTCKTKTGVALPAGYFRTDVLTRFDHDGTDLIVSREVESVADGSGEYTRWEDGTIIESKTESFTDDINNASGSVFVSDEITAPNYPLAVIKVDSANVSIFDATTSIGWIAVASGGGSITKWPNYYILDSISTTSIDYTIKFSLKGTWY